MMGLTQWQGLSAGLGLWMLLSAVLLEVLARMLPWLPGPRWWSRACLLAVAALASQAGARTVPGLELLGDLMALWALGCFVEGLRRFTGARSAQRAVPAVTLLYLLGVLALTLWGEPPARSLFTSLVFALAWAAVSLLGWMQVWQGRGAVFAGIAGCTALAAGGWGLRAWQQGDSGAAGSAAFLQTEVLLLGGLFGICMLLVLLCVLAVSLRLTEQLQRESVHDPLTGALNRRGFELYTARLAALSAQLGQSVAVLMVDIDHFRQLNERHGSAVGDLALKSLGQLVQRAKRESDVFARLGGEEFCIVLPGTDVPGARVFADRLRRSFAAFEIDTGDSFLSCTISIGVGYASATALQAGALDLVDLLRQADEALYEAKRAGRNRVRFFASAEVMSSRLDSRLFTSTIQQPES